MSVSVLYVQCNYAMWYDCVVVSGDTRIKLERNAGIREKLCSLKADE